MDRAKLFALARAFILKHQWPLLQAAAVAGFFAAAGTFMMFGPPKMIELTETPEFCGLCHASQEQDWLHSAHRGDKCIDCHLPNNNTANHYLWKSIDGGKDVFLQYSGIGDGNNTELTGHGKEVLQANCIRCHVDMVWRINNKRTCIDCHRPLGHRRTAVMVTREEPNK
ncbi:MAG TPA: cytochrome c nitrite reductase small subunit [Elusimicrobia bacterium]|nr:cytochrome c nitrite reductase small subunit [Elusimicrobiota bacterium]